MVGVLPCGIAPARAKAPGAVALVYVWQAGCSYCRDWEAKIGAIYDKTDEAKRAPLRPIERRTLEAAGLVLKRPVRYTPTFVLVADDAELGRIEGFPGEDLFWWRLGMLLNELPAEKP
ncbi:regulatory protein SoxS [Rhodovulum sp. PH10]|nr:regulatory protein SoxS [Rhodovulum sp. PH10]